MTSQSAEQKPPRFNRIHAICQQLREGLNGHTDSVCKRCPIRFKMEGMGWCVKGCVVRAQEVINIVLHGNPWGKRAVKKHAKRWRRNLGRSRVTRP